MKSLIFNKFIPIVGLALAVWGVFNNFSGKELSYEETLVTEFGEETAKDWKEIKFFFKDKEISGGGIVNVRFKNTGSEPIFSKDFDQPIAIILGDDSKILSAKNINSKPSHLIPKYQITDNKITIEPALFNPDDEITIQAVISGTPESKQILTRIGGIKEIIRMQPVEEKLLQFLSWLLILFGMLSLILVNIIMNTWMNTDKTSNHLYMTKRTSMIVIMFLVMPASLAIGRFLEYQDVYPSAWWGFPVAFIVIVIFAEIISKPFYEKKSKIS